MLGIELGMFWIANLSSATMLWSFPGASAALFFLNALHAFYNGAVRKILSQWEQPVLSLVEKWKIAMKFINMFLISGSY